MQKQLCENIKILRKCHRLTQKEMAAQLKISERTYQRIENGEHKGINLQLLEDICRIFSVKAEELFQPMNLF